MKAILMNDYGGPEVLQYCETSDPAAGPGEVVVDIHAASLNPADWKVREGYRRNDVQMDFPHILGRDFSGVVREAGQGAGEFSRGDAVFGVLDQGQEGTYAEALSIKAELVAKKPPTLSHTEAAAFAMIGLTTLVALEDTAQLKSGETILIHGGSGGVGGFAVQYAKHIGTKVFTTASARNHDYVRDLGADEAIDYSKKDFAEAVPKCDVVFDTIGGGSSRA